MKKNSAVRVRRLHHPSEDNLIPTIPLNLSKIHTLDDLVRAMGQTAFTARQIGDGADVLEAMARDKHCCVVLTLSGALTVAKMGLVICDLIDSGIVGCVVSTGALMAHGLVEATGRFHYRHEPGMNDTELFHAGYNRVYDSLEPEINLDHVEAIVQAILRRWNPDEPVCSWKLNRTIGEHLAKTSHDRGILKSAYLRNVPVFVPAFTDSELGIDLYLENRRRLRDAEPHLRFEPYDDFEYFVEYLLGLKRLGIFTIGGGVPRNWAQQFGVSVELRVRRGFDRFPLKRYQYGLRICPEPVHWGGLSGSTYSEGISWGKFVPPAEGGRFAEVLEDATVALPLIVGAVLERMGYWSRRGARATTKRGAHKTAVTLAGR